MVNLFFKKYLKRSQTDLWILTKDQRGKPEKTAKISRQLLWRMDLVEHFADTKSQDPSLFIALIHPL